MNSKERTARGVGLAISLAFMVVGCVQGATHMGTGGSSGGGTGGSGSAGSNGGGTGGGNGTAGSNGSGGSVSGSGGATTTPSGGRSGTAGSGAGGMTATGSGGAPGVGGHVVSGDAGTRPDLTGRTALFIVDNPSGLDDGDVLIEQLLQIRGMTVTFGTVATPPAMASNFNVVIMSSGLGSDTSFSVFKDVPVPMIVFGNGLYQTMASCPTRRAAAAPPTPFRRSSPTRRR